MLKTEITIPAYKAAVQTASVFLIQNVPYWIIAKCTENIWHFILIIITGHCVPKSVCGSMAECRQKITTAKFLRSTVKVLAITDEINLQSSETALLYS